MLCLHLPHSGYLRQPWRNGRGTTLQIYASGGTDDAPDCRLSLARIEADGPFSPFPGQRRQQMLVSGAGCTLDFPNGPSLALDRPYAMVSYAGAPAPSARLLDGPVEALNLIHQPNALDAQLRHRPLLGNMVFFARPGLRWLMLLLAGEATLSGPACRLSLASGDACLLQGESGRACLEGGAELALLQMQEPGAGER